MYRGYFDDDKKKSVVEKLSEALKKYHEYTGEEAKKCLLNTVNASEFPNGYPGNPDLELTFVEYVRPNNFWCGVGEF